MKVKNVFWIIFVQLSFLKGKYPNKYFNILNQSFNRTNLVSDKLYVPYLYTYVAYSGCLEIH